MTLSVPPLADRAEALEAQELRLLAHAVGDHLPHELALRVQAIHAERVELATLLTPAPAASWASRVC
ncbi:MAG: hypothetical protein ACLGHP_09080 [Vicinamibacteria bacterium]